MEITTTRTEPYDDQAPGTAGLRRTLARFEQPNYLENFIQSIIDSVPALVGARVVLGGDGRYGNRAAIQKILRMLAANGIESVAVGCGGILSTPAASIAVPVERAAGAFVLTASHNPAGVDGDFGIKFNTESGGQASESLTDAIAKRSAVIDRYLTMTGVPDLDIDRPGTVFLGEMRVDIIDSVRAYADLMERIFDFDAIRRSVRDGLTVRFDAMNAVTGPYATELLVRRLGLPEVSLLRATPREDFGGIHPDPMSHTLPDLMALVAGEVPPDLAAASDGDGDRNLIAGGGTVVSPCDSLAVMVANAALVPGYRDGLRGVARSMPTSHAVDRVAARLGLPCHETPTGWRFFCNLLESGDVTICGEESFGTSSNHCREKDGLWSVLFWLNLLAVTGKSVPELLRAHWDEFGRTHFLRHDFRIGDPAVARGLYADLRDTLAGMPGRSFTGRTVVSADEFAYTDPVDGRRSERQGLRLVLDGHARVVFRLSGTDTAGATLRIYIEDHTEDRAAIERPADQVLGDLAEAARDLARITPLTGLTGPTAVVK